MPLNLHHFHQQETGVASLPRCIFKCPREFLPPFGRVELCRTDPCSVHGAHGTSTFPFPDLQKTITLHMSRNRVSHSEFDTAQSLNLKAQTGDCLRWQSKSFLFMKHYLKVVVSCNQQLLSSANQAKMIECLFT